MAVDQRFEIAPELRKPSQQRCPGRLAIGFLKASLILKKTTNRERRHFWWLSQTWKSDPKMQIPQRADPIGGKHMQRNRVAGIGLEYLGLVPD